MKKKGKQTKLARTEKNQLLPPEQYLARIWTSIPSNIKAAFFSTFVIGFLVHGYMLSNFLLNHDGFVMFVSDMDVLTSGRFFMRSAASLSGRITLPWVMGSFAILFASLSVCAILFAIKIKSTFYSILIGFVFVTFPASASMFAYIFMTDAWYASIFLACLGVYTALRFKYGYFLSGIFFCLSLGIYQSSIFFSSGLYVITLILGILRGESDFKEIFFKALEYVCSLAIGIVLYFLVLKANLSIRGLELIAYKNLDSMGKIDLRQLPGLLAITYKKFILFFVNNYYHMPLNSIYNDVLKRIYVFIGIIGVLMFIFLFIKKDIHKNKNISLLLFLLVVLLPLAINGIYVLVPEDPEKNVYLPMLYPLVLIPVFGVCLLEMIGSGKDSLNVGIKKKALVSMCWVQVFLILLTAHSHYILINQAYMKEQLALMQAQQFSSSLLRDIEACPEYENGMEIIRIGYAKIGDTWPPVNQNNLPGFLSGENVVNSGAAYPGFLKTYLGVNPNIIPHYNNKWGDWIASHINEIQDLDIYPAQGSIKVIDGVLVVKFSTVSQNSY